MTILLFLVGLVALFFGGDLLVRGAVAAARSLRISDLLIGMTVVGFGTSLPELLVSVQAAWSGYPGIALGNVIGSNVANILLILGAAALLFPVRAQFALLRRDLLAMLAATVGFWLLIANGMLGRIEGLALIAALTGYLVYSLNDAEPVAELASSTKPESFSIGSAFKIAVGLGALIVGAHLLVDSATILARKAGLSEAAIGLTVVAVGTSLPELATSLVAAWHRNASVALGNVIGSNLFNIMGIMGVTAAIFPVEAPTRFSLMDMPIALATACLLTFCVWRQGGLSRTGGALLLAGYGLYVFWVLRG